ncbi:MAG: hypothetical protein A3C88_02620 [Candidatus Yanofskybacteria bacterium RIFCSPHIGHO2_02_FULL_50_12]|uniref:dTDP-4-dehydrorhamnose reductase n=1 Tax=Candidatus Yanofskybacteria bacterium RIFCSPHIGHO2_02_FULL_50_12 TaxID=1802685 RepID=A0A1F8FSV4_9BACT|nr:MAG: hypothetical protein A3C88_02620 [Candidatus Yanofskybacteria bacterium RIFCSPHIGHO2_02_FULL_50_12]
MKKVLILGATGMLGNALYRELKDNYSLVLAVRNPAKIDLLEKAHGGTENHRSVEFDATKVYEDYLNKKGHPGEYYSAFLSHIGPVDYVINAAGVTIPFSLKDPAMTLFINGALPHILSRTFGEKLIHVTTDCAFSGAEGYPYHENSPKTPVDLYGKSKSLGEPEASLTLRTSIIGRELDGKTGLLEWFLQQEGKEITGFSNHFWNGLTTKEFAKVCNQIIQHPERYPRTGLYHIFSNPVSKLEMLNAFKEKFGVNCTIKDNPGPKLNRTLATVKEMNSLLGILSFKEMVSEL